MTEFPQSAAGIRPLGEILLEDGAVSLEQLSQALEHRRRHGLKLGQALIELGLVDEAALTGALKRQGRLYCIELSTGIVDARVAQLVEASFAREQRCIAINRIAGIVTVAMEDPSDLETLAELALAIGAQVLAVYADPRRIDECIDYAYAVRLEEADELAVMLAAAPGDELRFASEVEDSEYVAEEEGVEGPVFNLIQALLAEAVEARASALHFEPRDRRFVVRLRSDGALHERLALEKGWARPCIARLKLMCGMDVAWGELPQEGSARIHYRGESIALQATSAPTAQGESLVLRLEGRADERRELAQLGAEPEDQARLRALLAGRGGLLIVAGPADSGRRTTLRALLTELDRPDRKLVAIERQPAPASDGTTVIALDPAGELGRADALRAALAQDADVVLLDALEDADSAALCLRAALDGRFVLLAISAAGPGEALARMSTLGVDPRLLSDVLLGVIAQRLVRRPCPACRRPEDVEPERLAQLGLAAEGARFTRGTGCRECRFSGYSGRLALFEIAPACARLRAALYRGDDALGLRAAALAAGMRPLREAGLERARRGDTTLSEVLAKTEETA